MVIVRRFTSYGPPDEKREYAVPRTELIEKAYARLVGENPAETVDVRPAFVETGA